jgi:hypothetical protein
MGSKKTERSGGSPLTEPAAKRAKGHKQGQAQGSSGQSAVQVRFGSAVHD